MFPAHLRLCEFGSVRMLSIGLVAVGVLCGVSVPAFANDGGISMGGTPRLLSGHPSVTMTSEVINIVVGKDKYTVDCRFVFTNNGPACTVRMGFPDQGYGANNPDEEVEDAMHTPPRTTFTSFRSYVDGKLAATKLVRANEEGHYWHTKLVHFPAHSVRRVRDVYTQRKSISVFILNNGQNGYSSRIAYILHTGSSWHGNIGRSEVNVTFSSAAMPQTPQLLPLNTVAKTDSRDLRINSINSNAVVWKGPSAPQLQEKMLHFVRTNWRPTAKDDVELTYNYSMAPAH